MIIFSLFSKRIFLFIYVNLIKILAQSDEKNITYQRCYLRLNKDSNNNYNLKEQKFNGISSTILSALNFFKRKSYTHSLELNLTLNSSDNILVNQTNSTNGISPDDYLNSYLSTNSIDGSENNISLSGSEVNGDESRVKYFKSVSPLGYGNNNGNSNLRGSGGSGGGSGGSGNGNGNGNDNNNNNINEYKPSNTYQNEKGEYIFNINFNFNDHGEEN